MSAQQTITALELKIDRLEEQKSDLIEYFKVILSGHLPARYPMTERGLINYHRDMALSAIAQSTNA